MLSIFIDADACPVKQEVIQVAERYRLNVTLVANTWMRVPQKPWILLKVVKEGTDAADDWIAGHAGPNDIVITADILLAGRCLKKEAHVIGPTGKRFTEETIGQITATRNLMSELRDAGAITGGPPPMTKRHRSNFLQQLDTVIQAIRREYSSSIADQDSL